jgi:hypothetical protein
MSDYIPKIMKGGAELTSPSLIASVILTNNTINQQEATRQSHEADREFAETQRDSAESARVADELTRESNEETRVADEITRQDYYNAYKVLVNYNSSTDYIIGNKVTYQGGTYQCITNTTGNPPTYNTDNTWWKCIAAKGTDGAGGDMFKSTYDPNNKNTDAFNSENQVYDNTTSGLSATNAQAAIDELKLETDSLGIAVSSKASQSDLNSTNFTVSQKANQSDLSAISDDLSSLQGLVDSNYIVLDGKINSQASGSPKGTYATLTALTSAYPAGNSNIYVVTADGNWYYWNGTAWTAGGVYQSTGIANNSISEEKLSFVPVNGIPSKNKFNKSTAIVGYYVRYQDGVLIANASYTASDFIPVLPSTAYRVSGSGGEQGAFYDINKNYISGLVFMGDLSTTPSNCYYVRLTVRNENINITQIEKGTVVTPYEPYGNKIKASQVIGLTSISYTDIIVDLNGGGDYTNISSAVASISENSYYNRYNIIIKPGTYNIFANLTSTELGNYGLDIPDYVNLIGEGNPILNGEIPSGIATLDNTTRISTLNTYRNNELKNLTITAKNMRYAVHDDSGNTIKNWERRVENCTFIHYGNDPGMWLYTNAWGEGCSSGSKSYFKNCRFISSTTNPAYSTHNNVSFLTPSFHEFDCCNFISLANNGVSARFGSMGSGQIDRVIMKGCGFAGYISIIEELGNGVGIDFKFDGYSNQKTPYGFSYTSVNNYLKNLAFEDEVYTVLNLSGSSISPKDIVKITGINQVSVMNTSDSAVRFYGIVLESIPNGSYGKVRVCGYMRLSDTNLPTINVGDKVGIVSGALAVVTSGDYVGTCEVDGYIRLTNK